MSILSDLDSEEKDSEELLDSEDEELSLESSGTSGSLETRIMVLLNWYGS